MGASEQVRIVRAEPVTAGSVVWRFGGQLHVTVIVKATFAVVHDADMELIQPAEVVRAELHHRNNPTRSVRATSDLAPYVARPEVVLTGHACAPRGAPATQVDVRLAVLRERPVLDKTLRVRGDLKRGERTPFDKIPLVYEKAAGGVGWPDNPFGSGLQSDGSIDPDAANIVDPRDPRRTAGFGPISRSWPARKRLLGNVDRKVIEATVANIPAGFDWSYFQSAPPDQRLDALHGDEWIALAGVHPDLPEIRTRLPGARAIGQVRGLDPDRADTYWPLDFRPDSLQIDMDAQTCSVVWRGILPIRHEAQLYGMQVVVGIEVPGVGVAWPQAEAGIETHDEGAPPAADRLDLDEFASSLILSDRPDRPRPPPGPIRRVPERPAERAQTIDRTWTIEAGDPPDEARSLPFARGQGAPAPRVEPAAGAPRFTGTVAASLDDDRPVVPFRPEPPAAPPAREVAPDLPPPPPPPPSRTFDRTIALSPEDALVAVPSTPFGAATTPGPSRPEPEGARLPIPGAPWSPDHPAPAPVPVPSDDDDQTLQLGDADDRADAPDPRRPAPQVPATPQGRFSDAIPFVHATRFVPFTMPWRLKGDRDVVVVVIKATCDLVPDSAATLRAEGDPPSGDVHVDDDPTKTVLYPSDFAIFKPRADVVLSGHAYAPRGESPAAQVELRFGRKGQGIDRKIAVFGERRWAKAGIRLALAPPKKFQKVPLVYERAFGGPGFEKNPVGLGRHGDLLPQLEAPDHLVTSAGDAPDPACFAAIPARWQARWSLLGTYDARWQKSRWPHFPEDFDWSFFQSAPPEQQLEHLDGDEPFELVGVLSSYPKLKGTLPGVRPRCFVQQTEQGGGELHEVTLRLDTVSFHPDEMKVCLVWRGLVEVSDSDAPEIAELFVMEEPIQAAAAPLDAARAAYLKAKEPKRPDVAAEQPQHAPPPRPRKRRPPPPDRDPIRREVIRLLAEQAPLAGLDLSGGNLSDLDFSGRALQGTIFKDALLRGCLFKDADLSGAQLASADLSGADLTSATLHRADFSAGIVEDARFDRAIMIEASFDRARADRARFCEARGKRASFAGAKLSGARFDRAEIADADFTGASLDEAVFDGAKLPSIRLFDATGARVSFKEAALAGARADGVKLTKSSFQKAVAPSSTWDQAVLDESTFRGAVLAESSFARASCERTLFAGADLAAGRLRRAKLQRASFVKASLLAAQLEGADLRSADLRGANLHGAETWKAKLKGAQLSQAILTQTKLKGSAG